MMALLCVRGNGFARAGELLPVKLKRGKKKTKTNKQKTKQMQTHTHTNKQINNRSAPSHCDYDEGCICTEHVSRVRGRI